MTRHAWRLTNRLAPGRSSMIGCLVLLLVSSYAQAQLSSTAFSPRPLSQLDTRYPLASLAHSSGFMPAPAGQSLENAPVRYPRLEDVGLAPDFRQHSRYWLYTGVVNNTDNADWVLHISNFGFRESKVLLRSPDGTVLHSFGNDGVSGSTDINSIGRAVKVTLQPGEAYQVIVEVSARFVAWDPYIALMSAEHYAVWDTRMDFAFKLAIGAILTLVLLGFLCWILTAEVAFFWGALASLSMTIYYLEHSSLPALFWQSDYDKTVEFWMLVSVTLFAQLAFAASFLQIDRQSRWHPIFLCAGLLTFLVCAASTVASFPINMLLYALNYIVVWAVILSSGVAKIRTEGRYYIIYILGWLPPVLSILQVIVTIHAPQRSPEVVEASYKIISVLYVQILHMFLHAVALILRIKALREEKLRTEFISQAKSRFIAQSSHDLNQPLHAMNLFLDHLRPHVQGDEGQQVFHRLQSTQRQMRDAFKAIMDLSKLEAGGIEPTLKPVYVADLFAQLQHEYGVVAAEKGIQLRFHSSAVTVFSDPILLARMLRNLISNAIKYTDSGRVVVGCRRRGQQVLIQVLDTGLGIGPDAQPHIFDIYQRSAPVSEHCEGSGIGLSIVRHIAELLNQPVTLTSTPGRGSCFSISVPRLEESPRKQPTPFDGDADRPVIALVFEDPQRQDTLAEPFRKWHCPVTTSASIDTALATQPSPSILLCDLASLDRTALSAEAKRACAQRIVAACVTDPEAKLPGDWIPLTPAVRPSQLRALLNIAIRRQSSSNTAASQSAAFVHTNESFQPE